MPCLVCHGNDTLIHTISETSQFVVLAHSLHVASRKLVQVCIKWIGKVCQVYLYTGLECLAHHRES